MNCSAGPAGRARVRTLGWCLVLGSGLAWAPGLLAATPAGHAHDHGVARMDVAVEPGRVSIALDTPLDNLVGFERAPRTAAERERVASALARLRAAEALWRIDPAAGCKGGRVELRSAVLGLGSAAGPGAARDAHADLEAQFEFECADATRARFLEHGLFKAFPGLRRLEVQVVTPQAQMKRTLQRSEAGGGRLPLFR